MNVCSAPLHPSISGPSTLSPTRTSVGKPLAMRLVAAALGAQDMRVHSGFLNAYDSVRQQVRGVEGGKRGVGGRGGEGKGLAGLWTDLRGGAADLKWWKEGVSVFDEGLKRGQQVCGDGCSKECSMF